MNRSRRRALVLAVAMGSTAALARWVQPSSERPGEIDGFSLDAVFPQAFGPRRIDEVSRDFVRPADQDGKLYGVYYRLLERTYIDTQGYRPLDVPGLRLGRSPVAAPGIAEGALARGDAARVTSCG